MSKLVLAVILCLLACSSLANEDFYQLLGVQVNANEGDIKRAFRRKSIEFHPDKNPGDEGAAEMFRRLNRAYEVLLDKDKRHVYDSYGEDVLERYERGEKQLQRGPNSKLELQVTLEELYSGTERYMTIGRDVICDACRGTGAKDGKVKTCPHCNGKGVVLQNVQVGMGMQMQMQTHCPKCGGAGTTHAKKCPKCKGRKVHQENKTLHVVVEPGMQNEEKITFEREGQQQPDIIPGDVIFILKQAHHKTYSRVGDDLYTDMTITLQEAVLGFSKTVRSLDGRKIEVKSEPNNIVQPFSWKIIKGEGMPLRDDPSERGDLHIKFNIKFPKTLTDAQKEAVKAMFKEEDLAEDAGS